MMRCTRRAPPKKSIPDPKYTVVYDESEGDYGYIFDDDDEIYESDDDNNIVPWDVSYYRNVLENGVLVEKPARKFQIILKEEAPVRRDSTQYFLRVLEKVTSNPEEAFFTGTLHDSFDAILMDDEYEKLRDLDEVLRVHEDNDQAGAEY